MRQAPPGDLDLTGELRVRISPAQGGEAWDRGCVVGQGNPRAWSQSADGGRSATLQCGSFSGGERDGDFGRALERVRAAQAAVAIVPQGVMVLPVALEDSLPYEQAVEVMSAGGCLATGNCEQAFIGWRKSFPPAAVVLGFLMVQLAVAALIFRLSRRVPLTHASRRVKRSLGYLAVVVRGVAPGRCRSLSRLRTTYSA